MYLLGLAPGGVCLATDITACAGGLLHRRFTLTSYDAIYFSVALAVGLLRLTVSQHRALWSADFPRCAWAHRDHEVNLDDSIIVVAVKSGKRWLPQIGNGLYNGAICVDLV